MRPDLTADANTPTNEASTQSFEADVSRLLHLMVHSVYSDREIFVRELVSNAADACEKLRYEAIARPELTESGPFAITVSLDPEKKTLTVADNGVGMTREDLISGLGTIARSGTKAFLDRLAAEEASKAGPFRKINVYATDVSATIVETCATPLSPRCHPSSRRAAPTSSCGS